MKIYADNCCFVLDATDSEFGVIHAQMIVDFEDKSKLERFIDLLNQDANTAFNNYCLENNYN